jgi:hypothetical protein
MNEMKPVLETPGRASSFGAISFSRHRYELPLLAVFLLLALLELVAVHLLVSMWSAAAAWVLTALTVVAMVQIAALIHGLVTHATEIDDGHVHVRHGRAGHLAVPLGTIERAEDVAYAPEEKGPAVFRASLIASPNVALRLREPVSVGRRRAVSIVTLRLDEPQAFLDELRRRTGATGSA